MKKFNLTSLDVVKDLVHTSFLMLFIIVVCIMTFNSDSCVLRESGYSYKTNESVSIVNDTIVLNDLNSINNLDFHSQEKFFKSVSSQQRRVLMYVSILYYYGFPLVYVGYALFLFLFIPRVKKDKVMSNGEKTSDTSVSGTL